MAETRPLQSLAEFDAEKLARWEHLKQLEPNGIACPACGNECGENALGHVSGNPPKWQIACLSCGWHGHRIAC